MLLCLDVGISVQTWNSCDLLQMTILSWSLGVGTRTHIIKLLELLLVRLIALQSAVCVFSFYVSIYFAHI